MFDIICSLVAYKNSKKQILDAINSFFNTNLKVKLVLIDNSPTDYLRGISNDSRFEYIHNPSNPGYGSSHNIVIKKYLENSKFHLILNPDIYYHSGVVEDIIRFMDLNNNIGLVMPKIMYPNGQIQYLAKLIPTPFIFFVKRFFPNSSYKRKLIETFELRFTGYNKIIEVPYLSGCFMFFKTDVLKRINGFDENIFMHFEDLDITRRCIDSGFIAIYYPKQTVYHDHQYKTFLTFTNVNMYFSSAFYYFNKWGWIFDKKRKILNQRTLFNIRNNILK